MTAKKKKAPESGGRKATSNPTRESYSQFCLARPINMAEADKEFDQAMSDGEGSRRGKIHVGGWISYEVGLAIMAAAEFGLLEGDGKRVPVQVTEFLQEALVEWFAQKLEDDPELKQLPDVANLKIRDMARQRWRIANEVNMPAFKRRRTPKR